MERSDLELVSDYLQGEEQAFSVIVSRYTQPMYNFIARVCGDREEAHDLTQEVFVKVWKNIRSFDVHRNFKTWMYRIARNTAIDWLRKRKHVQFSDLISGEHESFEETLPSTEPLPGEVFARTELKEELERALSKTHPEYRMILLLHLIEQMTFEEMADVLNKPMNTVKSQYRRALLTLRRELGY